MPAIRVDHEVKEALAKIATREGMVFRPPNEVIRRHLGLDGRTETQQPAADAPTAPV